MHRRPVVLFLGLLVSLLLVAAACGGDDEEETTSPPPATTPAPAVAPATSSPTDATALPIATTSGPYAFLPADLTLEAGKSYDLVFTVDGEFHTFTSDELNIDVALNPNSTLTHTISIDTLGSYEFICLPHQGLGMKGTITVE